MVKFFNKLINILLIIIIVILAVCLILKTLNIIRVFNVKTGSMEDKIHSGDYVLTYKTDKFNIGDIVTYKIDNYYITHRIIKMENGKVTTKGDANNVKDDDIDINQIEGKVVYYGALLNFIIIYRFIIVIFLIGLYTLNLYFLSNNKNDDELNEEEEPIDEIKE